MPIIQTEYLSYRFFIFIFFLHIYRPIMYLLIVYFRQSIAKTTHLGDYIIHDELGCSLSTSGFRIFNITK